MYLMLIETTCLRCLMRTMVCVQQTSRGRIVVAAMRSGHAWSLYIGYNRSR